LRVVPFPIADLLIADRPAGNDLDLFARFVGQWEFDGTDLAADGTQTRYSGRWDFAYVLGGRAIQDVLYCAGVEHGTTVRVPRGDGVWDVVWITPMHRRVTQLQAREDDPRIVISGLADGRHLRWTFNDITSDAFVWRGEESPDGRTFRLAEEMRLRRVS
jgi:hypothetical protein